mgnify:CR=1 FL=1
MKLTELLKELQTQVPMCSSEEHDVDTRKAIYEKKHVPSYIL